VRNLGTSRLSPKRIAVGILDSECPPRWVLGELAIASDEPPEPERSCADASFAEEQA
jgi:hypothetical protein